MKKRKNDVEVTSNGKRPFSIRDSIAYAAGDLGCNMSFALKGTMAIFWTQVMGLSLWYSILLIVVQVWDAINDPLIGSIIDSDKRKYRRNKFLQYILIGSFGLIVGGACCFLPFPSAPTWAKIILFIAGYVIWDAFYTIANVPYGSLLSLISDKPEDRASLSAWRSIGSMIGNMVPMVVLPMIIYDQNNNLKPNMVFLAALIMGALGFVCFQFMIRNTEIRVEEDIKCNEDQPKFNVFKAMKNFLKNRPAVGATIAAMGMFLGMQGAATAVTVVFQSYYKNASISGIVSMFAMIPILVFTPLARKMVVKYGKKELSIIGAICSIIGAAGLFIVIPNSKGLDLVLYVVCQLVYSLGLGIYSTVSWAMMGDAIDYNEWKTETRDEGVVYSLHSFFRKLAQGLGPAMALVIMAPLGYVNNSYVYDGVVTVTDVVSTNDEAAPTINIYSNAGVYNVVIKDAEGKLNHIATYSRIDDTNDHYLYGEWVYEFKAPKTGNAQNKIVFNEDGTGTYYINYNSIKDESGKYAIDGQYTGTFKYGLDVNKIVVTASASAKKDKNLNFENTYIFTKTGNSFENGYLVGNWSNTVTVDGNQYENIIIFGSNGKGTYSLHDIQYDENGKLKSATKYDFEFEYEYKSGSIVIKNINCTSDKAVSMKSLSAKYMEVGPYLYEIKADGSYNVSVDENGNYNGSFATGINAAFFGHNAALNMRILVAALYLVAAVMQFVGLALVYNLDKKTLATMNAELEARKQQNTEPVEEIAETVVE